ETCELGSQLRPHVVWFGEPVPMIETAAAMCGTAAVFMVIGTSLAVYPAAGLIDFVPYNSEKIVIDPKAGQLSGISGMKIFAEKAGIGVPRVVIELLERD